MHGVIDLPLWRLLFCAVLVVILVGFALWLRVDIKRELAFAAIRGTLQLLVVGYLLTAVFAVDDPWLVLGILVLMLAAAAQTARSRLSVKLVGVGWLLLLALALGTTSSLLLMTAAIVRPTPWYDPQYLIPFAGMVLGNSMSAAALAAERFGEELRSHRGEIETRLALGFSAKESVEPMLAKSLRAALIPILNSLSAAGIVQLPGMMTGQILGGTPPAVAVKYQILIFALILFSIGLSSGLLLVLLRRRYLSRAQQLRTDLLG